jgi:MFS family permease
MLTLGVAAQAAGTVFVSTPAFLIPLLHTERGVSLAQAGLLASTPTVGMVLTLVAWGALADRFGERWVIAAGLALTAAAAVGALLSTGFVELGLFLLLGGAAAASSNAASGRVVVGWFPKERRGLAMGIRQMSQPLGVTIAALAIPGIAAGSGIAASLGVALALNAVLAVLCAIGLVNPPRPAAATGASAPAAANPYRSGWFLWRIHTVSMLLVIPQFTLSIFGIVWLVSQLGWSTGAAGLLIAAAQFLGALGRIGIGQLSDAVGSRVRVLRWVAVAGILALAVVGATDQVGWTTLAAIAFVVATTISVADNGLAFTSVAEAAGSLWSGKALGVQNTGQFIAASAVGPAVGALIAAVGFPLAFGVVALAPVLALPLIPRSDREHASAAGVPSRRGRQPSSFGRQGS